MLLAFNSGGRLQIHDPAAGGMSERRRLAVKVRVTAAGAGANDATGLGTGGRSGGGLVIMTESFRQNNTAGGTDLIVFTIGLRSLGMAQRLDKIILILIAAPVASIFGIAFFCTGGLKDGQTVVMSQPFCQNDTASRTRLIVQAICAIAFGVSQGLHVGVSADIAATVTGMGCVTLLGAGGICHYGCVIVSQLICQSRITDGTNLILCAGGRRTRHMVTHRSVITDVGMSATSAVIDGMSLAQTAGGDDRRVIVVP